MSQSGRAFECKPCRQITIFLVMPETSPYWVKDADAELAVLRGRYAPRA